MDIKRLENFVDEMIIEFKEQIREDPTNFVAGFGLDIYKEIKEKIKEE